MPGPFRGFTVSKNGTESLRGHDGMRHRPLSRAEMGTIVHPMSGPFPASRLDGGGPFCGRNLRFTNTGRIANAAEEPPVSTAALDQPAIFAFRTGRITGSATTSNLVRSLRLAWQSSSARRACRKQVSAMLDMLTTIPDATVLPRHSQQPSATFSANMDFWFRVGHRNYAVGGILPEFGDKGRRARVRGEKRQGMAGPCHGDIYDAPFFRVLKCLFFR